MEVAAAARHAAVQWVVHQGLHAVHRQVGEKGGEGGVLRDEHPAGVGGVAVGPAQEVVAPVGFGGDGLIDILRHVAVGVGNALGAVIRKGVYPGKVYHGQYVAIWTTVRMEYPRRVFEIINPVIIVRIALRFRVFTNHRVSCRNTVSPANVSTNISSSIVPACAA